MLYNFIIGIRTQWPGGYENSLVLPVTPSDCIFVHTNNPHYVFPRIAKQWKGEYAASKLK